MENFKMSGTITNYHGTNIADPFDYLENPNAPDTEKFIKNQNLTTRIF